MVDGTHWNPAEEIELARQWLTGKPASQIGAEMNRTRNMIIGKARRMNLPPRAVGTPGRPKGSLDLQKRVVPPKEAATEEAPAPESVSFMGLEQHHCRYIVGKGEDGLAIYCGGEKSTWRHPRSRNVMPVSYCKKHADLCYYSG